MKKIFLVPVLAFAFLFGGALFVSAASTWDTTGSYVIAFDYLGTPYAHDLTLNQDGSGNLTGNGGHPAGGPHVYTWVITSGSVTGNTIDFYADYTASADAVTPQTTMHVMGTINPDGSMSGTWTDNYQGGSRGGSWTSTSGMATLMLSPDSKEQCKKDGWKTFNNPTFKNQGDCVSYMQSNEKAVANKVK